MITEKESYLYFDFTDTEMDIIENLRTLISCGWDSNNIKLKLVNLIKQFDELNNEIVESSNKNRL